MRLKLGFKLGAAFLLLIIGAGILLWFIAPTSHDSEKRIQIQKDVTFFLPTDRDTIPRVCFPVANSSTARQCLPSVISPGVQKSGTSFAYMYLTRHPNISRSETKEVNFFKYNDYQEGIEYYTSFFTNYKTKITLDFSPKYLMLPESAELIYQTNRAARFVIMFRDPVYRAYSHYQYMKSNILQSHYDSLIHSKCPNRYSELEFRHSLAEELSVLQTCKMVPWYSNTPSWLEDFSMPKNCTTWKCNSCSDCFPVQGVPLTSNLAVGLMSHGIYYSHIEHYLKYFPIENFLFVRYEDLKELGEEVVLDEISTWMGVGALPEGGWGNFTEVNSNEYPPMDPEAEQFLREFYKEPNRKFYKLIGRDMKWT